MQLYKEYNSQFSMAYEALKMPNEADKVSEKRMNFGANYKLNENIDILFKVLHPTILIFSSS